MASHAHRNPLRWIVKREDRMFPVIRCHKNALHLRIIRNSPEANSSWGIAYFGLPPGFWFKGTRRLWLSCRRSGFCACR
jgi:hypothetical protein